jgi:2'-5' RNA ligase
VAAGVSDERVRLFVALELPERIRDALVGWRGAVLREVPGLRPVARESLHVTLCFLGWRRAGEVGEIGAAVEGAARSGAGGPAPVRLSVARDIWLPPRRPRVLAVELEDGAGSLTRVQAELSRSLQAGGWYEPEARPFLAHVTVARVARGVRPRAGELPAPQQLEFEGARVTLYRSRLGRGGARYEPLVSVGV